MSNEGPLQTSNRVLHLADQVKTLEASVKAMERTILVLEQELKAVRVRHRDLEHRLRTYR